jgi:NAD(P)-dependent dehydrogenase (short-subunit alcohol dehydrogenase family)
MPRRQPRCQTLLRCFFDFLTESKCKIKSCSCITPTLVLELYGIFLSARSGREMKTAVVIGVGPKLGLGAQLCRRFAADGLQVIIAGRTKSAIEDIAEDIARAGGKGIPVVADATSESDIAKLFDHAGDEVDLAIYNAGNNTPGKIIDMEAGYFEQSWRIVCFGGFLFAREAARRMVPNKSGTILFTGASASLRGRAGYGAFNSAKAALRAFAQAMAKEYAADGIHVAHVVVDGAIAGDKIFRRFPEAASRENSLISIEAIVDAFVFLHRQPPRGWSFEIDVRTSQEKW